MQSIKNLFLGFVKKHYTALFVTVITPPMWLLICWIEETRQRRLSAVVIVGVIGVISVIYAHTPAYVKKITHVQQNETSSDKQNS